MSYPKPMPVGRPRVCDEIIREIRNLHFNQNKSYNWIAWYTGIAPKTCQRYCTGKWRDYEITA